MQLLAKIGQAHTLITRVLGAELRQHAPHGLVFVVIIFKLLQGCQQCVPTALGNADREHDEKRIKPGFFHDHAVLGEILGHNRCRNSARIELALDIQARGNHRGLDRVKHVETRHQAIKAVPVILRVQVPLTACRHAVAIGGDIFRAPDLEPPVQAKLFIDLAHGTAKIQRLHNRLFYQRRAPGWLHHGRCDIQRRNNGVLRACRGVHQVRFIKQIAIQGASLRLLHQNLRGL